MQQRVEILRALYRNARILVLDEPTAVLTAQEITELMAVLRRLKADGTSIIFISHKLGEVLEIADRITVLRRGKSMGTVPRAGATEQSLARMVVGRDVIFRVDKGAAAPAGARSSRSRICTCSTTVTSRPSAALRLTVRGGEIVAARRRRRQRSDRAGAGDHRHPGAGERTDRGGRRRHHGSRRTRGQRCRRGAHRRGPPQVGLVLPFTLAENLALRGYRRAPLSRRGWLNLSAFRSLADRLLDAFDVRGGRPETPASALSGGNQQKLCIAREIDSRPEAARGAPADARAGCRRDRVRPQPADRAARCGQGRAAGLAWSPRRSGRWPTGSS